MEQTGLQSVLRQYYNIFSHNILPVSLVYSIAKGDVRGEDQTTEAFIKYYDIFVRHAFGNYLDILKEVAYSPIMGENLSYIGSISVGR